MTYQDELHQKEAKKLHSLLSGAIPPTLVNRRVFLAPASLLPRYNSSGIPLNDPTQLIMVISGEGGTGKSSIIALILEHTR